MKARGNGQKYQGRKKKYQQAEVDNRIKGPKPINLPAKRLAETQPRPSSNWVSGGRKPESPSKSSKVPWGSNTRDPPVSSASSEDFPTLAEGVQNRSGKNSPAIGPTKRPSPVKTPDEVRVNLPSEPGGAPPVPLSPSNNLLSDDPVDWAAEEGIDLNFSVRPLPKLTYGHGRKGSPQKRSPQRLSGMGPPREDVEQADKEPPIKVDANEYHSHEQDLIMQQRQHNNFSSPRNARFPRRDGYPSPRNRNFRQANNNGSRFQNQQNNQLPRSQTTQSIRNQPSYQKPVSSLSPNRPERESPPARSFSEKLFDDAPNPGPGPRRSQDIRMQQYSNKKSNQSESPKHDSSPQVPDGRAKVLEDVVNRRLQSSQKTSDHDASRSKVRRREKRDLANIKITDNSKNSRKWTQNLRFRDPNKRFAFSKKSPAFKAKEKLLLEQEEKRKKLRNKKRTEIVRNHHAIKRKQELIWDKHVRQELAVPNTHTFELKSQHALGKVGAVNSQWRRDPAKRGKDNISLDDIAVESNLKPSNKATIQRRIASGNANSSNRVASPMNPEDPRRAIRKPGSKGVDPMVVGFQRQAVNSQQNQHDKSNEVFTDNATITLQQITQDQHHFNAVKKQRSATLQNGHQPFLPHNAPQPQPMNRVASWPTASQAENTLEPSPLFSRTSAPTPPPAMMHQSSSPIHAPPSNSSSTGGAGFVYSPQIQTPQQNPQQALMRPFQQNIQNQMIRLPNGQLLMQQVAPPQNQFTVQQVMPVSTSLPTASLPTVVQRIQQTSYMMQHQQPNQAPTQPPPNTQQLQQLHSAQFQPMHSPAQFHQMRSNNHFMQSMTPPDPRMGNMTPPNPNPTISQPSQHFESSPHAVKANPPPTTLNANAPAFVPGNVE